MPRELTPEEVFAGITEAPAGPQRPAGVKRELTAEEQFAAEAAPTPAPAEKAVPTDVENKAVQKAPNKKG